MSPSDQHPNKATSNSSNTSPTLLSDLRRDPTDPVAWDRFVKRYGGKIHAWCRRWRLQEADCEDVTQTVLILMAQAFHKFHYDESRSFRHYLNRVTRNALLRFRDRQERVVRPVGQENDRDRLLEVEAREDLENHLSEEFDMEIKEEAMARVKRRVEPRTWQAFELLTDCELSGAEVGRLLGMEPSAALVARYRVVKMLKEEVQRIQGQADEGS